MDAVQAGDAFGIFFWGYLLLQIPGGHLATRWSAKRFVSILLVLWGICAVGCGFVRTAREFWVMRLLLGVAEGGVWPATLVLLSHWFPRGERARANAFWMLCLPVSVVVSSPVSGWILSHWNWRVLLIAEGALPFVWLLVWGGFIEDTPEQARWISTEERDNLTRILRQESAELQPVAPEPYLRALLRPQVLIMVAVYLCQTTASYGYLSWLPSALESAKKLSNLQVGILTAIPYAVVSVGMVLNSHHSDRTGERRGHIALALGWGGVFLLASVVSAPQWLLVAYVFLCLAAAGPYSTLGPFWAIPTETLPAAVAGSAMGLVNAIGNLGGHFGPLMVGYLNRKTGSFAWPFAALSLVLLTGSVLAFFFLPRAKGRPISETAATR